MSSASTSRDPLPAAAALRTTAPSCGDAFCASQTFSREVCNTFAGDDLPSTPSHRVFRVHVRPVVKKDAARLQVAEERTPVEGGGPVELPPFPGAPARGPDDGALRRARRE